LARSAFGAAITIENMDEEKKPKHVVWFEKDGVIELQCPIHGKVTRVKGKRSPLKDDDCLMCILDKAKPESNEP
jgi:hypothetical protein